MTEDAPSVDWLLVFNRVIGTLLWVVTLWVYAATGLVAPMAGVFVLWVIGAMWLGIATRWWHRKRIWYAASPLFALGSWLVGVNLGAAIFGWTA